MWTEEDDKLKASFEFEDFKTAFAFMTRVAFEAESIPHHPNWTNVYNTVDIELTTHDAGNKVTEKDRELAEKIKSIYQDFS